jgi:threonine-phosphate decarboxylase
MNNSSSCILPSSFSSRTFADQPYHGALDHAELAALGVRPEEVCDFSSNINPFGPPRSVRQALAALDPAPYPDRSCYRLRLALAERHGCAPEEILVGNGSNELIHLIARVFIQGSGVRGQGSEVDDSAVCGSQTGAIVPPVALIVGPTYGEYAHAVTLAGGCVVHWTTDPATRFQIDTPALCGAIRHHRPQSVWLCTPNNPTGASLAAADIAQIAERCHAIGAYLILDRAYAAFENASTQSPISNLQSLVALHSLTKSYALAGLRLGYVIADAEIIRRLAPYQPTWSVNSAAQAAGLAALSDDSFLSETIPRLWEQSDALRDGLQQLGLKVLRNKLPFLLVHTGDGARTRTALLQHGFLVRDCASFGLPAYVRIAPRGPEENARLVRAWSRSERVKG